jgi:adenine phosphoribosyltransferase
VETPALDVLREKIRVVPDFPKAGIGFKDITPLLASPDAFQFMIDALAERYAGQGVDQVVGIEARGFILAAALAYRLKAGLTLVRKPGKLPAETLTAAYELEYGTDELQVHRDAVQPGTRVVLVDDVLATGGTIGATLDLLQQLRCTVVEVAVLIELSALNGRERLADCQVYSLIQD